VLFGTETGTFYAVDAKPLKRQWEFRDPDRSQPIHMGAAVNDRAVVFASQGKQTYAVDPASGKLKWQFATRSNVESSPVIAGELVFLATTRGRLYALEVDTGAQAWEYEAGGKFIGSPAVSEGRLVIGNEDGTVYCFGEKK
jgi:outer membrane protein assembly factor BamB